MSGEPRRRPRSNYNRSAKERSANRYSGAVLATPRCVVDEDGVDARLIREPREADKGKARFTVNELRAQCGSAVI